MNVGIITCSCLSVCFLIIAMIFQFFKEKATILISGFNYKSKEERNSYDKLRISKNYRNMFIIWTLILGIGAILSYLISSYIAIPALIIWLVVFAKDVHFDIDKEFDKYRIKQEE